VVLIGRHGRHDYKDRPSSSGGWGLRPTSEKLPWPDVAGKRCLDLAVDGEFDVVVMGYVLQMVRDPLRALARSCAGRARPANI
jgi:hypothetical protein